MYYLRTPSIISILFPSYFNLPGNKNGIKLTFDDGPELGVSDAILTILESHKIQATFFMLGNKAEQNPGLAKEILAAGHQVGSHSYEHLDAWKTNPSNWNKLAQKGQDTLEDILQQKIAFFRPPYGHFIPGINKPPIESQIILWNLMPGDFDSRINLEDFINRTLIHTKNNDIVVLHDNLKAAPLLLPALPRLLTNWEEKKLL
jgi:peptidoglycan/xylan/chitin deacetylase (PgdA/CDA1 family)